jgi:hypothetical protein
LVLGKLVCDRLGLNPASTARDWSNEVMGETAVISTSNFHFLPAKDLEELQRLAAARSSMGGARA